MSPITLRTPRHPLLEHPAFGVVGEGHAFGANTPRYSDLEHDLVNVAVPLPELKCIDAGVGHLLNAAVTFLKLMYAKVGFAHPIKLLQLLPVSAIQQKDFGEVGANSALGRVAVTQGAQLICAGEPQYHFFRNHVLFIPLVELVVMLLSFHPMVAITTENLSVTRSYSGRVGSVPSCAAFLLWGPMLLVVSTAVYCQSPDLRAHVH